MYLKGTPGQGILLPRMGESVLTAFYDSDWLGCPYTIRSRMAYLRILGGVPISWKTKKYRLSPDHPWKKSIEQWLLRLVKLYGCDGCLMICKCSLTRHPHYFVTTRLHATIITIQYSMNAQNMSIVIVSLSVK